MNEQEQIALLQTVVACLVQELCWANDALGMPSVARIQQFDIENPPEIEHDDDPYTGEWIYRLSRKEEK